MVGVMGEGNTFIEGEVEITVRDRTAYGLDDHEMKLWVHRAFRELACYRISEFERIDDRKVRASVALKTTALPLDDQRLIQNRPNDHALLKTYVEKLFEAKGKIRLIREPKLIQT
mgnify:CR=1 FL=1